MRRPDYFYELTAEKLSLPKKLVEKVNRFYWKNGIKEPLKSGEESAVYIRGIGTMYPSRRRLRRDILKQIMKIRVMSSGKIPSFNMPREERIEMYYKELRRMLKIRDRLAAHLLNLNSRKRKLNEQTT